jgi:hypothetical protein
MLDTPPLLIAAWLTVSVIIVLTMIVYSFTIAFTTLWLIAYQVSSTFISFALSLSLISLFMCFWCFFVMLFSDPGTVAADLERRGLLKAIRANSIPANLRHLPLCKKCQVPRPPLSHHCVHCGSCFLRRERHSQLWGRCIADNTFKASILMFVWGGISGTFLFLLNGALAFYDGHRFPFLVTGYSVSFGSLCFACAVVLLSGERIDVSYYDRQRRTSGRRIGIGEIIQTFGETWWQKMSPIQAKCTRFAWAGVDWDSTQSCRSEVA